MVLGGAQHTKPINYIGLVCYKCTILYSHDFVNLLSGKNASKICYPSFSVGRWQGPNLWCIMMALLIVKGIAGLYNINRGMGRVAYFTVREEISMITREKLLEIGQNGLQEAATIVNEKDIQLVVTWLLEEDPKVRKRSLLLLQNRSMNYNDVYHFWPVFAEKLRSDNPAQKSIGIMLIAANTKWDKDNKIDEVIDAYLACLSDKNPTVVRQCIQSLHMILPYKRHLYLHIADKLISISIRDIDVVERGAALIDILEVLMVIRKGWYPDEVEQYISLALAGDLLDQNDKKRIKGMMW